MGWPRFSVLDSRDYEAFGGRAHGIVRKWFQRPVLEHCA